MRTQKMFSNSSTIEKKVNPSTSSGLSPPAALGELKVHQVALLAYVRVIIKVLVTSPLRFSPSEAGPGHGMHRRGKNATKFSFLNHHLARVGRPCVQIPAVGGAGGHLPSSLLLPVDLCLPDTGKGSEASPSRLHASEHTASTLGALLVLLEIFYPSLKNTIACLLLLLAPLVECSSDPSLMPFFLLTLPQPLYHTTKCHWFMG